MTPTPREEAIELIRKFYSIGAIQCKQCALIAVDEILKVAFYATNEIYEHYIQVKTEIEKL